jgi:hypothetical protein
MLAFVPETGSLGKAARDPEPSSGDKRELEHMLVEFCRFLNSKRARSTHEIQLFVFSNDREMIP